MTIDLPHDLPPFLSMFGLSEAPMGVYYTERQPEEGLSPSPGDLPTREKEKNNAIEWPQVFGNFSCVMGHIWRARKKQTVAWFSAERFGCPGGAFWLGFLKPQSETIIHYVSSGIPNVMEGEFYCDSPDHLRKIFTDIDPVPAPHPYVVFKPLSQFTSDETPLFVNIFARPESLSGLHQLATYVTNDPEIVASPWSAACGSLVVWPNRYRQKNIQKAVLGGWDPSARKFFKTDELSFTVPWPMFKDMLVNAKHSFLKTATWQTVKKKIDRSKKSWGEE